MVIFMIAAKGERVRHRGFLVVQDQTGQTFEILNNKKGEKRKGMIHVWHWGGPFCGEKEKGNGNADGKKGKSQLLPLLRKKV